MIFKSQEKKTKLYQFLFHGRFDTRSKELSLFPFDENLAFG